MRLIIFPTTSLICLPVYLNIMVISITLRLTRSLIDIQEGEGLEGSVVHGMSCKGHAERRITGRTVDS